MEATLFDDNIKAIRSDPQLLTKSCEQLLNEMNAMENEQQLAEEEEEEEEDEEDVIEVDKVYNNMREIRLAAIEYGRRRKFAVSTLRSGARQLVLACKHSGTYRGTKKCIEDTTGSTQDQIQDQQEVSSTLPAVALEQEQEEPQEEFTSGLFKQKRTRRKVSRKIQCPFQIRAKPIKGQQWVVYKMVLEHNHPMAPDSKAYAQHRKLDEDTQKLIVRLMRSGSTNTMIVKYLSLKGIRNVVRKDIANLRQTYFNPNNNKLSATGAILYQVEKMDENNDSTDSGFEQEQPQEFQPQEPQPEQLQPEELQSEE